MQKILITTGIFPPDIGGPATYCYMIVNALIKRGFKATVITYIDDKNLKFKSQNEKLQSKIENLKLVRISKKWPWFIRHIIYASKIFFAGRKNDIIYSLSTLNGGIPSFISSRFFKKKFYLRIAGDYAWQVAIEKGKSSLLIDDFQQSKKLGWIKFLFRIQSLLCKKADLIIVPSEYLKKVVKGWGVEEGKISVIYNAVDFEKTNLPKEEARKKIGIPGNIILSSGRLVPWKGFRMLIKIMPRLLELNQFFRLVIVGDGPEKKNLELMVKNMGLDRKVFVVGKKSKEELSIYLAASDMFVLNSGYEGFSHQILEVMAAGVPVIASAMGGNKEVIEQGENGFLVRYNDEFNLVEAIKGLWQSPELQKEFSEKGKETVKKFSVERMVEETIKILSI